LLLLMQLLLRLDQCFQHAPLHLKPHLIHLLLHLLLLY